MSNLLATLAIAAMSIISTEAAAAPYDSSPVQPGTFVGARFQLALGGKSRPRPRAALALAPTFSRIAGTGVMQTSIGEGLALNLTRKPALTIAGVPAERMLGIGSANSTESGKKLGLSKGGWIAVGVGTVLVAAAAYGLSVYDEARDNSD